MTDQAQSPWTTKEHWRPDIPAISERTREAYPEDFFHLLPALSVRAEKNCSWYHVGKRSFFLKAQPLSQLDDNDRVRRFFPDVMNRLRSPKRRSKLARNKEEKHAYTRLDAAN